MKKNLEIISLAYKSINYLRSIVNQLKTDSCKIDGWDIGIRIILNDATSEVIEETKKLNVPYTIFNNTNPDEYYLNRVYRAYNHGVITSKYDNICLVNSDNIFSENWLRNLLKHHDGINIPSSRLIESAKMQSGRHGVSLNLGRSPETFDYAAWEIFVKENSVDQIHSGGLYMPAVFEKSRFIESGMYPEGNIYHDGIGTTNGRVIMAGDDYFFHEILEKRFGMKHITPFDSLVYHVIMGEKDE